VLVIITCLLLSIAQGLVPASPGGFNRREAVHQIVGTGLVAAAATSLPRGALSANVGDGIKPIAVLGANGRTGALCVAACLERGIAVRALTRTGSWTPPPDFPSHDGSKLLDVRSCDVKETQALRDAVSGCSCVIYAASASKKGGDAKQIDNFGVVAAADACLAEKVPRYIVISSTAVTRPESLGYKFTNVFGGIMDEKLIGEEGVRAAYKTSGSSSLSYAIVRPGGLEEPKKNVVLGPRTLEISQGDAIAGIISRADLAESVVEMTVCNSPNVRDATFELYYTDSAQACAGRFKPLLTNGVVTRLHGDTYQGLFSGIKPDGEYAIPL
jgi:uncharacterized protein YbjT (DUF2867 family)